MHETTKQQKANEMKCLSTFLKASIYDAIKTNISVKQDAVHDKKTNRPIVINKSSVQHIYRKEFSIKKEIETRTFSLENKLNRNIFSKKSIQCVTCMVILFPMYRHEQNSIFDLFDWFSFIELSPCHFVCFINL